MRGPTPGLGLLLGSVTWGLLGFSSGAASHRAPLPGTCAWAPASARHGVAVAGPVVSNDAATRPTAPAAQAKLYVATELEDVITVVDAATHQTIRKIKLGYQITGTPYEMAFYPRGIAVAPDQASVWVAAPIPMLDCPDGEGGVAEGGPNLPPGASEEIVVLDPSADTILARIEIPRIDGIYVHLTSIVIDRDSRYAYVTANGSSQIIRLDVPTRQVLGRVDLGANRDPLGIGTCDDKLLVANGAGRSLSIVETGLGTVEEVPLEAVAVRAVCSSDGRFAYVSLFDTREVARYEFATGAVVRMPLPKTAIGPTQLAVSRDGRRLYVLDQGTLLYRPPGNTMYELDPQTGAILAAIPVGRAPRGLVLSVDGKTAYTSNYYDGNVSVVDLASRRVTASVAIGTAPNGIGVWRGGEGLVP